MSKQLINTRRAVMSFCLPLALLAAGCSQEKQQPIELATTLRQELSTDSLYMSRAYAQWARGKSAVQMPIDLTDPGQYNFVVRRIRASGNTKENSPELFSRLEKARVKAIARKQSGGASQSTTGPIEWCGHVLSLSERAGGTSGSARFEQRGLVTCRNGSQYLMVDANAYWTNSSGTEYDLVDSTSNEDYGTVLLETSFLNVAFASNPGRRLVADSMSMAFNDTEDHLTFTALEDVVPDRPAAVLVDEPVERIGGAPIRTCLERGSATGTLDCDYASVNRTGATIAPFTRPYTGMASINRTASIANNRWIAQDYWAPSTLYNESKLYQPMKGSFDPGAAHGAECSTTTITSSADIILVEAGGRCRGTSAGTTVASAPLMFDPAVPGITTRYFNGLVDFGVDCLGYQQDVKLVVTVRAESTCGTQTRVPRTHTYSDIILDFKNSCLAEGTQILRADGSSSVIEKIQVGDKVISNTRGQVLTVTTVSKGIESRKMIRLRDAEGRDVLVTSKHPLITGTGKVLAAEALKVGDVVHSGAGTTRLTSVEQVDYKGQVYNLTLGTDEELVKIGPRERTMIANGFLVGDNEMQADLERPARKSENILARLSKSWHQDYKNDLARKQGSLKSQR